ncbi:hypothetical protein ZWY2020_034452 [Hordeum vulgare]|nr:hypothetical protein ZWY2020_034452 [Hordeum vulgare]
MEGAHGGLEAYDVAYATAVRELPDLLDAARVLARRVPPRPEPALPTAASPSATCPTSPTRSPGTSSVDGPHGYAEGRWGGWRRSTVGGDGADKGDRDGRAGARLRAGGGERCARSSSATRTAEGTTTPSLGHYPAKKSGGAAANREAFCGAPPSTKKAN